MIAPASPAIPTQRQDRCVAAFFDVDNTLLPGSAIEVRFFRYLWRKGHVGSREATRSLWYLLQHLPALSLHPLRERKLYLEGKRPAEIEPLAAEFVQAEVCPRLSSASLAALERHRDSGHHLVLITGSLDFLIAPLAGHLKVDLALAAVPERRGDRYTGSILPPYPYGEGKRRLVESFAKEAGIALQDSYAYGDSPGDVDTLRLVGHPLVVNPIRGMGRIARREGWRIETWK
ncbi:MAG: HAD family hydrolase [Nitrospirota bacterium]|nr:HAD family hydrolase [Nitrospirota bacterium]MDE3034836.1 HAD family hydrolase [Nitrospirota bacterium]